MQVSLAVVSLLPIGKLPRLKLSEGIVRPTVLVSSKYDDVLVGPGTNIGELSCPTLG